MTSPIRLLKAGAAAALLCVAVAAHADDSMEFGSSADSAPSAAGMAADLIVARPLGLAATVLGTAVFVVALPFSLISGNVSDPARRLIVEPAAFTFTRPLGTEPN